VSVRSPPLDAPELVTRTSPVRWSDAGLFVLPLLRAVTSHAASCAGRYVGGLNFSDSPRRILSKSSASTRSAASIARSIFRASSETSLLQAVQSCTGSARSCGGERIETCPHLAQASGNSERSSGPMRHAPLLLVLGTVCARPALARKSAPDPIRGSLSAETRTSGHRVFSHALPRPLPWRAQIIAPPNRWKLTI
jgi:hypothetical protein